MTFIKSYKNLLYLFNPRAIIGVSITKEKFMKKIDVQYNISQTRLEVKRDMSYLLTPEGLDWLTKKPEDDYDYSDEWKEQ